MYTATTRADQKLHRRQAKEPPSERQIAYLTFLGHPEPCASMAEASDIIDRLLAERRTAHRRQREAAP